MSIVELKSKALCKLGEVISVSFLVLSDNILNRSRYKEILLLQAEAKSLFVVVVRVKNIGDSFGKNRAFGSLFIVLSVECAEVEALYGFSLPKTECVYSLSAVADYGNIIRNSHNGLIAEINSYSVRFTANAPSITVSEPVVCGFLLESVADRLLEKTVAVADTIAVERNITSCCGIEEAGCKSSKSAVSESSILNFFHAVDELSDLLALFA